MSCPHTFHGLCDECKKPVQVKVSGSKVKTDQSLNTLVKTISRGGRKLEIDRLEDTKGLGEKGGYVYHVFEMDGSARGRSVGGDFISIQEAMDWATEEYATI
jgi:hypothetical protein